MKRMIAVVVLLCVLWPGYLAGQELAREVAFSVPLADGSSGTGIVIDGKRMPLLVVATANQPPKLIIKYLADPDLGPDPPPDPIPDPDPKPVGSLHVVIIEETEQRTQELADVIVSQELRKVIADAQATLLIVDDDIVDENGQVPAELSSLIELARKSGLPRLFVTDDAGTVLYNGAVPKTVSEVNGVLDKFRSSGRPAGCPSGNCPVPNQPASTTTRWRLFRR